MRPTKSPAARPRARAARCRLTWAALGTLLATTSALAQTVYLPWPDPPIFTLPPQNPGDLVAITAGGQHACVAQRDGAVYCWGRGDSGQLGLPKLDKCGSVACALQPTHVAQDVNGAPFASTRISGGRNHTCALDAQGAAYCWGYNLDSQTGVAGLLQVWQPTAAAVGMKFGAIGAGSSSTCAVEPGATWCWGLLGDGSMNGPTWQPMAVPSSGNYQAVSVGFSHACMQTNVAGHNDVNCIGTNGFGELGFEPSLGHALPVPFGSDFGRPVGPPSTTTGYTCVDRYADGTVVCAGNNASGTLGDGTTTPTGKPQPVGGGAKLRGVATGFGHACAIDPQQQAWCWGDNVYGQLGNGNRRASWTPVLVGGGAVKFRALAAGDLFTCGIATDNQVYCWGDNAHAQLGRGYYTSYDYLPRRPSLLKK